MPLCRIIIRVRVPCFPALRAPLIYLLWNFDDIAGSDSRPSLSLAYSASESEKKLAARVYLLAEWNCARSVLSGNTSWYKKKYSHSQLGHYVDKTVKLPKEYLSIISHGIIKFIARSHELIHENWRGFALRGALMRGRCKNVLSTTGIRRAFATCVSFCEWFWARY